MTYDCWCYVPPISLLSFSHSFFLSHCLIVTHIFFLRFNLLLPPTLYDFINLPIHRGPSFMDLVNSDQGHTVISMLLDVNGFWQYDNRSGEIISNFVYIDFHVRSHLQLTALFLPSFFLTQISLIEYRESLMQQHNAAAEVEDVYRGYDDGTYNWHLQHRTVRIPIPDLDTIVYGLDEILMFSSTRAIHDNIVTVISFLSTFQFLICFFLIVSIIKDK